MNSAASLRQGHATPAALEADPNADGASATVDRKRFRAVAWAGKSKEDKDTANDAIENDGTYTSSDIAEHNVFMMRSNRVNTSQSRAKEEWWTCKTKMKKREQNHVSEGMFVNSDPRLLFPVEVPADQAFQSHNSETTVKNDYAISRQPTGEALTWNKFDFINKNSSK